MVRCAFSMLYQRTNISPGNKKEMSKLILGVLILISLSTFAAAQSPKSNWANLEKSKVHYYDTGNQRSRSAIVFIHGWTCNADFWKASYNAFPQQRVITIDLIGHGNSDKPNAIYSMDFFARSVEAVLNKAKVDRAVLVGHSMGTPVARQFYRRIPNKVAGIVIVDGALRPYLDREVFEKMFAPVRENYVRNAPRFLDGMLSSVKDAELRAWIREQMLATRAPVALSAMDGMGDPTIWNNDSINVPVLAVMARSEAWKDDEEEFFRSIAPTLEFKMWDDASHFLMMERPAEFNSELSAFISKYKLL